MATFTMTGKAPALEGLWLTEAKNRDVQALDDLLLTDEEVLLVGSGHLVREGFPAVRRWIIAATSERLLCVRRGHIGPPRVVDVPRHAILSVSTSRLLLGWQLVIATGQGEVRVQAARDTCIGLQQILGSAVAPSRRRPVRVLENEIRGLNERSRVEYLENAVERLESDISRLQQQVDFLEDIIRTKSQS